ncbi:flagellar hook-basal body protein [Clostridium sp. DL-VIII]|uniref:flagellar hook-basal body complex protein n=1 Tax=Clostridium sp. DL-VIII TaxID=641107 RepID=UPI00023B05C7|nr:flagellar hook-basal body complex protein [Clostridium sp. DL-VIII]EHJ01461.1 flagellar hook-basal body protein [Clostridium sp. DL-VIII]
MFNIFAIGKSGMSAYQEKLDYLSNDLVNQQTTGYKSTDVGFKDLLAESLNRRGTPLVNEKAISGTGVKLGVNYANNEQGNLKQTGEKTDLAIDGEGYFAITQSDGTIAYTRDGNFKIDSNGTLVDANGKKVYIEYTNGFSEGNPQLDSKSLSIAKDGTISMNVDGQPTDIGTIPVFTAVGDKSFIPIGNSCFIPASDAQVTMSTNYNIEQGFLEGSNVDPTEAFSDVILTQRAFQLSSKAITTADDMWSMINNMR